MTTLEIRVRCVSSFEPDLLLSVSIENTVLQLKQEISKSHPAHPVCYLRVFHIYNMIAFNGLYYFIRVLRTRS